MILDMVGGAYVERNLQALAVEGRLVQIGIMEYGKVTLGASGKLARSNR